MVTALGRDGVKALIVVGKRVAAFTAFQFTAFQIAAGSPKAYTNARRWGSSGECRSTRLAGLPGARRIGTRRSR